ncbi:MAG: aspartate dehydrogenase [Deltaproteobacteria bacterium]
MRKKLKIGIAGCGAIGTSLARTIVSGFSDAAVLTGLYDLDAQKAERLAIKIRRPSLAVSNLEDLISGAELIIEATRLEAVFGIAKKVILAHRDIMVMSVGGILRHYRQLQSLAHAKGTRIFIPSGAISGIDGLKAASLGRIKKVTLTTRKPARAFAQVAYVKEKGINLDNISEDTVLFKGNAFSATRAFPQNINVAATLSIAGIGPEKTQVRIIASQKISRNIHEIEIESDSGKIISRTENVTHPENPKTSYLAVLSAAATLKQILEPIKIGT